MNSACHEVWSDQNVPNCFNFREVLTELSPIIISYWFARFHHFTTDETNIKPKIHLYSLVIRAVYRFVKILIRHYSSSLSCLILCYIFQKVCEKVHKTWKQTLAVVKDLYISTGDTKTDIFYVVNTLISQ